MTNQNLPQKMRGMRDLLPDEHDFFTVIKKVFRHRARQSGFRRISTPVVEAAELFERGLGTADAAGKEMYRLRTSDDGPQMCLRPECTASVARAYIEGGMSSWPQPVELFYIEPCFRHDRPQRGRYRQFFQAGAEVIGARDASVDAGLVELIHSVFRDIGIEQAFRLEVNTIGTAAERAEYAAMLTDFFLPRARGLSAASQARIEDNPLRILDSKDEDDQIIAKMAPKFADVLSAQSLQYFEEFCDYLTELEIPFTKNPGLVRGLDYYTDVVFEFIDDSGITAAAGGRYDGLFSALGAASTPASGFSIGMDRVAMVMRERGIMPPQKDGLDVYLACLGTAAKRCAMRLLRDLHNAGVHARGACGRPSMREQLSRADRFGARYVLLLGDVEMREGKVILRDMAAGVQETIPVADAVALVGEKLNKSSVHSKQ